MGDMSLVTVFGDVLAEGSQGLLGDIGLALSIKLNNKHSDYCRYHKSNHYRYKVSFS